MLFLRRTAVDDLLFPVRQIPEGNVRADPHGPADIRHQRPHQRIPGRHRSLIDGQRLIRHQRGSVHRPHDSRSIAGAAGSLAVEGKLLRRGRVKSGAAHRAAKLLSGSHRQSWFQIMPVGAPVAGKPGKHQPETVQQFRACPEGTPDTRDTGTLVQGQGRRHVQHFIHLGFGRLGHPPSRIRGKGIQISSGALRIKYPQGQRGLSGAGQPRDPHNLVQGYIYINIFQIMDPRAADLYMLNFPFHTAPCRPRKPPRLSGASFLFFCASARFPSVCFLNFP